MTGNTGGARPARTGIDGTGRGSSTRQRDHDQGKIADPGTPGEAPGGFALRSGAEIVERFWRAGDPFGWEREVLLTYMTRAEAEFLDDGEWAAITHRPRTVEAIVEDASIYLTYSWGLALREAHRDVQRSMFKIDYWMWLLGHARLAFAAADDDTASRDVYCMPQLARAARALGAWPPAQQRRRVNTEPVPLLGIEIDRLCRLADGHAP